MKRLLGIDIGGTTCAVCSGHDDATVLSRREIPSDRGPSEMISALERHARDLLQEHGEVDAIGIVCGGPLDAAAGVVLSPPNLPGWDAIPVTDIFGERIGVPAFLQNDANAGALAEWRHGAGRGSRNLMFCTMGTGFGGGLVLDGKLYEGANGNAGEIGHIRLTPDGPVGFGKTGSVEGWCGGSGIARLARQRVGDHHGHGRRSTLDQCDPLTAKSVAMAANRGDELALAIVAEIGEKLGRALSLTVDILNLETIVIGGIFVRCEALLRPHMERVMEEECLPHARRVCTVRPAELGERIGDVAALTVAQYGLEANR